MDRRPEPTDMFRLDGRTALVTGSTRGLGWAIARKLADRGAHVVVTGRSPDDVAARVAELGASGGSASGRPGDLADLDDAVAGVDDVVARLGRLDILVNNAGVNVRGDVDTFGRDDWDRVLRVNLDAPFALAQAAARHMRNLGGGRIVNVASIMGTVARPTIPAYVASKGGVEAMTKALAVELAPAGITVNAVGPGYVATEMNAALVADAAFDSMVRTRTPVGRWGEPDEIAAAVVFLASDEASYITGQKIIVDGGMTVAV
ncbi:MAG: SDR family NAD(P)-dependent oxidoreductase [Ilumatobacteraceae bacterium]